MAFTDDDCVPAPDWLQNLAARFVTAADHVIIGGRTLNALPNNLYSTASQLIVDVGCAYLNTDPNHARFFTANNLALPADGFRALDGFDTTFVTAASEDRELCGRWVSRGCRMIYAPEVLVYHAHELTWRTPQILSDFAPVSVFAALPPTGGVALSLAGGVAVGEYGGVGLGVDTATPREKRLPR